MCVYTVCVSACEIEKKQEKDVLKRDYALVPTDHLTHNLASTVLGSLDFTLQTSCYCSTFLPFCAAESFMIVLIKNKTYKHFQI